MTQNIFVKHGRQRRARMFEFLMTLIVVGVLIYTSLSFYQEPIEGSQQSVIEFHAGIFSRAIANIHALGLATNKNLLEVGGSVFQTNENGWPANADASVSPFTRDQTAEECRQLWHAVFFNAPSSEVTENNYKNNNGYIVSLNQNVICRYELQRKQEGSHFFDYDVTNGTIYVHRP